MDEETVTNMVPISQFKSNYLSKKEKGVHGAVDSIPDI
jgi:hypothetical protein